MGIEIMDGKFFKDGQEIKPTFGDMEQIRALKEAEQKANEIKVNAKLYEEQTTTYYAVVKFDCPVCKYDNSIDLLDDEPSEYAITNRDVDAMKCKCDNCNLNFVVNASKNSRHKIHLTYNEPIEN